MRCINCQSKEIEILDEVIFCNQCFHTENIYSSDEDRLEKIYQWIINNLE